MGLLYWKGSRTDAMLLGLLLSVLVIILYRPIARSFWFTAYVGLAAYQNPYVDQLSDLAGYKFYERKTGTPYAHENDLMQEKRFGAILQEEVIGIVKRDPWLVLKNTFINTLLSFSVGYVVGASDWVNYGLAFLGLLIIVYLQAGRQQFYILATLATVTTFTLYYPPIPAYMFGAYPLLVLGVIEATQQLFFNYQLNKRGMNDYVNQ
ncbi:hypothetical protein GCM10023187_25120 [Nibrella viscosa]|uniref:Uncharacterized protein n=2 Tax=Nibrella viscosa TaxID=1084524 RepID=A0ABP8KH43_9BACT